MINSRSLLGALLLTGIVCSGAASESRYDCPKDVSFEETAVTAKVPAGWEAKHDFSPKVLSHKFENLSVYDGPPEEGARLVPDNEANTNPAHTLWTFNKKKERLIWLGCEYTDSNIILAKALPKNVTKCRLVFSDTKASARLLGLACQ